MQEYISDEIKAINRQLDEYIFNARSENLKATSKQEKAYNNGVIMTCTAVHSMLHNLLEMIKQKQVKECEYYVLKETDSLETLLDRAVVKGD